MTVAPKTMEALKERWAQANEQEFVERLQEAGRHMTNEQISQAGKEAEAKFGINRDDLMLLLISGKNEFKQMIRESVQSG